MMAELSLNGIAQEVYQNSVRHGFWDGPQNFAERLALIHAEVSEVLEAHRSGASLTAITWKVDQATGIRNKPDGIPIELADILIRVLELCGAHDIDIDRALAEKMAYNVARPWKHDKLY